MATMARSEIQKALRQNHRELVESLAEVYRTRFQAGELRGYLEEDFVGVGGPGKHKAPYDLFVEEIERSFVPTAEDAYLVLACSPMEALMDGEVGCAEVRWIAADCLGRELLLIARTRGWYTPAEGEGPDLAA